MLLPAEMIIEAGGERFLLVQSQEVSKGFRRLEFKEAALGAQDPR